MAFINSTDLDRLLELANSNEEAYGILKKAKDGLADRILRDLAVDEYAADDIEIDDEPATTEADGGTWVAAWVYVPNDEDETDDHSGED